MLAPLTLAPPAGFVTDEVVTTWRLPAEPAPLKDPKVMQFQAAVRPNLVAVQRRVAPGTTVAELGAQTCAELARHVEGLSPIETTAFTFQDGSAGVMLRYTMPVHQRFSVAQLQALRIDGDVSTLLTLSTEASRLDDATLKAYVACLAAATVAPR
jgi:hypothetical protein